MTPLTMEKIIKIAEANGVIVEKVVFYQLATTIEALATVRQLDAFAKSIGSKVTRYELRVPSFDFSNHVYMGYLCISNKGAE